MNDQQIESLLRRAPAPPSPAGLKEQLRAGIQLPKSKDILSGLPFWRRWFPALSVCLLLLGCFIALAVQTNQFLERRRERDALRAATAGLDQLRQDNAELQRLRAAAQQTERAQKDREELVKLRAEVAQLRSVAQELPALRGESQRLQAERAAAAAKAGVVAEVDPFAEAKGRAERIRCISNLKQIGLAARIWANDHGDVLPSDFVSMSNQLVSPKVLTCAADSARTPAISWQGFDGSNISYEMLSPGVPETDPAVVFLRCLIHQNVGLVDGSAHQLDLTVTRVEKVDGKFKLVRAQPAPFE